MPTTPRAQIADRLRRRNELWQRDAEAVRARLDAAVAGLAPTFSLKRVRLFGSLAWGPFTDRSDVDLLVWGASRGQVADIVAALWEAVGRPIHVVRAEDAPASLVERALQEGEELHVA